MIARLSSLVVWALAALAAVAWGLRIGGERTPVPAHAAVAELNTAPKGDWSRVMGSPPPAKAEAAPAPAEDARFRLVGVVAPRGDRGEGLALIAVDGKPARTLRQGRELEPGLVLQKVSHRQVELVGAGRAPLVLVLPPLAEAARGRPGEAAPSGMPQPPTARAGALPAGMPAAAAPAPPAQEAAQVPPQAQATNPGSAMHMPSGLPPPGLPNAGAYGPADPAPGTR